MPFALNVYRRYHLESVADPDPRDGNIPAQRFLRNPHPTGTLMQGEGKQFTIDSFASTAECTQYRTGIRRSSLCQKLTGFPDKSKNLIG